MAVRPARRDRALLDSRGGNALAATAPPRRCRDEQPWPSSAGGNTTRPRSSASSAWPDARLSDAPRVALTVELSRTWLGSRPLDAPAAAVPRSWQKARGVLDEFIREHPNHPRLLVVRVQSAVSGAEARRGAAKRPNWPANPAPMATAQGPRGRASLNCARSRVNAARR